MPRWARLLIDGPHPWGTLEIVPVDRTGGALRYRLVVFPPGITTNERRLLVLHRRWPALGTTLAVAVSAALGATLNGWLALSMGATVFVLGLSAVTVAAGDARRRTRRATATVFSTMGYHEVRGDLGAIERCGAALIALDAHQANEEATPLSPAEYEFLWGEAYRELAESDHPSVAGR